jgi:hypothetical protein
METTTLWLESFPWHPNHRRRQGLLLGDDKLVLPYISCMLIEVDITGELSESTTRITRRW